MSNLGELPLILERLGCDRDYCLSSEDGICYLCDRHIERKEGMNHEDAFGEAVPVG